MNIAGALSYVLENKLNQISQGQIDMLYKSFFELNMDTNYFEMLIDKDFRYEKEVVEDNDEFMIFLVENDITTLIKN